MLSRRISFQMVTIAWILAIAFTTMPSGREPIALAEDKSAKSIEDSKKTQEQPVPLESQILKLFEAKCSRCHGQKLRKADLNLSTPEGILKGSETGPVIVAGKPDDSPLYEMVHSKQMPPKGEGTLSDLEIQAIQQWISAGAKLPKSAAITPA